MDNLDGAALVRAEREEVARLWGIPEPDNHHNAYACPHCEAPIRAVEAERDAAIARAEAAEAEVEHMRGQVLTWMEYGTEQNKAGWAEREARVVAEAAIAAVRALCDMANERWGGEVPTGNIRRALDTGTTTEIRNV